VGKSSQEGEEVMVYCMELLFSVALHGACTFAVQQYGFAWTNEVVF
jgi:hypothetical protein